MREERAPVGAALAIESPSNPRIKAALRLRERRERESTGLTLVDGGRETLRAIEAGAVVESAFVCPPLLATMEAPAERTTSVTRVIQPGSTLHDQARETVSDRRVAERINLRRPLRRNLA